MKEHKFNVNDKVKIIDQSDPFCGRTGIVTVYDGSERLPYKVDFEYGYSWEGEEDLELAPIPKYSPGDRFMIEVESVLTGEDGKPLYKIKGFNALVFDDNGLDRLERAGNEEARAFRVHYYDVCGLLQSAKARADMCAKDIDSVTEMLEHIKAVDNG